ncbi:hypothetical protein SARC_15101 [Sphaeroforma arctica JP610]|uniref:Uncharacterized protein n=1 Tax=Sphaeroforma arctica JP610 TaxID=667725 RepID=A0A0L0F6J6_9EUKA|nr:hypothetical protein SARC_15101 [Sphaeroforma arctica JP610]KNC72345.1 hypothetical protein SARC_15101 [Sphaeroforma arctica JP610]|eukprot:XP_014146247.1 hypothetical protein SARC_15101 [Sphaeroforma arctica JP610]
MRCFRAALKETLEAQKYRKRTHGVDSIGLGTVEVDPSVAEAAAKKKLAEENAPRSGLVVPKK